MSNPQRNTPPSIPPKRFGWEAEQGGVDPATVSPPGGAPTRRSCTKRPRPRVHRPLELRAQATSRPPNRTPDFAHLIRALDEPVARRFVRAALTPSPTPNSFAPTQPGRSKARSFADSSASSFVRSEPTPRLPPPLTFLASSFRPGLLTDSSSPEPPSFLASAPSTLRPLSPHLLSPQPDRHRTRTSPPSDPLLLPSDRPPHARPPPLAPCPAALLPLVRSAPRFSLHAPFTPLRLLTPVHFHEMMSGCSKSAAAHPLRVRERDLDFRFEGYAGTMNRKGQGTSLAGAHDRPKRRDFRAVSGGGGEGDPRG